MVMLGVPERLEQSICCEPGNDSYASEAHGSVRGIAVLKEKNILNAVTVKVSASHLDELLAHAILLLDAQEVVPHLLDDK